MCFSVAPKFSTFYRCTCHIQLPFAREIKLSFPPLPPSIAPPQLPLDIHGPSLAFGVFFFFLASIDKHSRVAVCFDYFFFGSRHYIPCAQPPPPPAKEGIDNRSFLLLPFSKTPLLLLLALVIEEKASLIVSVCLLHQPYLPLTCLVPVVPAHFATRRPDVVVVTLKHSRIAGRTYSVDKPILFSTFVCYWCFTDAHLSVSPSIRARVCAIQQCAAGGE